MVTGKRHNVGNQAMTNVLGALLSQAKEVHSDKSVDLDKFVLSESSTRRAGFRAVTNTADEVRERFNKMMVINKGTVIIRIDGKIVKQLNYNMKSKNHRLAIIADSPDFPMAQVLGVPVIISSKGRDQVEEVLRVCTDWDVINHIFGVGFDTTSDNTGRHAGSAVTLLEKSRDHALLWIACRRHSHEVFYNTDILLPVVKVK